MEKEQTLKQCPFCGGNAVMEYFFDLAGEIFRIKCVRCGILKDAFSEESAVLAWNRRTGDGDGGSWQKK